MGGGGGGGLGLNLLLLKQHGVDICMHIMCFTEKMLEPAQYVKGDCSTENIKVGHVTI